MVCGERDVFRPRPWEYRGVHLSTVMKVVCGLLSFRLLRRLWFYETYETLLALHLSYTSSNKNKILKRKYIIQQISMDEATTERSEDD